MRGYRAGRIGLVAAVVLGLPGCLGQLGSGTSGGGGYNFTLPDLSCTADDRWDVRGLQYEHFAAQASGALLSATLRRGDVVRLQVTTRHSGNCESAVAAVQWVSTAPDVADVAGTGREADLLARNPGETHVYANVTLRDGQRLVAELHAVPSHGSPVMRVYTVRVVR